VTDQENMASSLLGRVLKGCFLLAVALAIASLVAVFVIRSGSRPGVLAAAAAAAGVAWIAASAAFIISAGSFSQASSQQNSKSSVAGILFAMAIRMAVPLAALVLVPRWSPNLAANGFAGLLVVNYLVALALETYLSLGLMPQSDEIGLSNTSVLAALQRSEGAANYHDFGE
jgi:hypothetical protein